MATKEILRPQWDQRKMLWKIAKKTNNGSGGWKRFGGVYYVNDKDAERVIERLTNNYPDLYEKDK